MLIISPAAGYRFAAGNTDVATDQVSGAYARRLPAAAPFPSRSP